MIKYVLFDLDGTLLSTLNTITHHLNSVLRAHSFCEITVEDCSNFIGNGARKLVSRALSKSGEYDEDTLSVVLAEYNRAYDSDPLPMTHPYEGIVTLVDRLFNNGITLGVVTNKPESTAKILIEHFFPGKFKFVSGGRSGAVLKPDPKESVSMLASVGGTASECAFVGDTPVDILTGKNMNAALSVGVSWGFRSRSELLSVGADVVIDEPSDLFDIVFGKDES